MDEGGAYRYLNLDEEALGDRRAIPDFAETGSREVLAEDFVYQIKRLAHPRLHSPILELMSDYVVGLREYASTLREAAAKVPNDGWIDLRKYPLEGVELVDHHTYRIRLKGAYPQFPYWLAMPFFAPVPYEVDRFSRSRAWQSEISRWIGGRSAVVLHALRKQSKQPHGAEQESQLSAGFLPVRGRTWRRGGRAARRLRQGASATRQGGVYARTGEHPILEQIPAGLLRCFRRLLRQFRPGGADGRTERREHQRRDARARHQPDDLGCADGDVHGLQHARSGCRRRR